MSAGALGESLQPAVDGVAAGEGVGDTKSIARECVLEILASFNAARLSWASVRDVAESSTDADRRRIFRYAESSGETADATDAFVTAVGRVLRDLVATGRALEQEGQFLSTEYRDALARDAGRVLSRRRKTLAVAERAVARLGRAVRARDVADHITQFLPEVAREYSPLVSIVARDLQNLSVTGELLVVGHVRASRADGSRLYLPARLADRQEQYRPREPLSWLDYVLAVVARLWAIRIDAARQSGAPPRPLATQEIRAELRRDLGEDGRPIGSKWGQDLEQPMTVQLALDVLSGGGAPAIRSVPGRTALWVPADVDLRDLRIDRAFALDSDRVVEAIRRAMVRVGCPAVTAVEVEEELELDDALALNGKAPLAVVLNDLAKTTVDYGNGSRRPRRLQRVHRVGRRGGATLYAAVDVVAGVDPATVPELRAAHQHAHHGAVLKAAEALRWEKRLEGLGHARSPAIALGRARLLEEDLQAIIPDVRRAADEGSEQAATLRGRLERSLDEVRGWVRFRGAGASSVGRVARFGRTLTPEELRDLYAPLSPTAERMACAADVVRQYSRLIQRVPNPTFVSRRSGDPRTAQLYLFDAVDALCYGARLWGGTQAQLAALMVQDELGELRDAQFVFQALQCGVLEHRLRAVACLAFLQPEGTHDVLLERAFGDTGSGVRELSIWGLGFMNVPEIAEVMSDALRVDPSVDVKRAVRRYQSLGPGWAWMA